MNCGTPTNNIYSIGCVATGFSPSTITFKWTDDRGRALTDFVQYPAVQSGVTYTGVSQLRVAKNELKNSKSFNCFGGGKTAVINSPFSQLPTVSLLSAPTDTTQYLMCMMEDLDPNEVTFTWKKNDKKMQSLTLTAVEQPSGLYSASSLLKVMNTDWNNKVKYSCEVQHQKRNFTKMIFKIEPLTVTLNPPRVKDVFVNNQAVLECVITGTDNNTVSGTSITWQVNGQAKTDGINSKDIESKGNLNTRVSTLTLDHKDWTNGNKVQCSAMKSGEVTPVIRDLSFSKTCQAPSVSVQVHPEEDTNMRGKVTLVCLVVSPSLCDVYIMWIVGERDADYQEGVTNPPQKTPEGNYYFVTSIFTTTKTDWDAGKVHTCSVKHTSSDNNTAPKDDSVSKSKEKTPLTEPEVGFALSCMDSDEDEFSSLWSTTSSFIILFLLSLTYSTVLSLVKMKQ